MNMLLCHRNYSRTPKIDGINHSKVVSYIDVLKGKVKIANSIAIIGAGGIGFDVAEYLSHSGTSSKATLFMKEWELTLPL